MKKLISKLRRRKDPPTSSRITTDTVAEHREQILAGGRRFKYPIQYARHKLVINAIVISLATVIVVTIIGYWQLYSAQNTSEFIYRVTKVLPLPVASIDGQPVLYSDYLMKYRSSIHYLEQKEQVNLKTDDGKRQVQYIKKQSMDDAVADAYAAKMAKRLDIGVTDSEIDLFMRQQRQTSDGEISEKTYEAVILDYYDWSPDEYRHVTRNKLLRQKVAYGMDKAALSKITIIYNEIKNNPSVDLKAISDKEPKVIKYGVSGWVPKTNQDGGLANAAAKLKTNQISDIIKATNGSGYYVVKLIEISDKQVKYAYIQIPLSAFQDSLGSVSKNKLNKYIKIEQ